MNACWYYRPEQTVHRFDKHFYDNEVVKTGQYRDHRIEDVEDRCFVMFITRYPRGRPRGLPADKSVYVCEARYNEERFKLNKIKTWTSCLPDEVREKDYEMDLFDIPRMLKKVPSPIKHLLQADAKETDDLPKPTWRSPNAPPLIGAVHRRPREPNVSSCLLILRKHCASVCLLPGGGDYAFALNPETHSPSRPACACLFVSSFLEQSVVSSTLGLVCSCLYFPFPPSPFLTCHHPALVCLGQHNFVAHCWSP